ncbi:MAG: DUF4294 domain-containing protein [Bacteroidales bacterium]|nr:DUF4294 domain-containing protein [Bacteroidales bacterium]
MKRLFLIVFVLAVAVSTQAQTSCTLPCVLVNGDTLGLVKMPKMYIFPPMKFHTKEEVQRYKKLVRDVKKVYPYSQIAKNTFNEIQNIMDSLPNNKQRKKYIKAKEDELVDRYAKELVSLTVRQGEILSKLVERELNKNAYDLIKELRGSVAATMWQCVAKMFGESLKNTYDAKGEDLMIERIVIQIEQGMI